MRRASFMTEQEKQQILSLKQEGLGYKKIAVKLSLNVNSVKSFLQRNRKNPDPKIPVCPVCKKPLAGKQKRFCSKNCSNKWWNSHQSQLGGETRNCQYCGKKFHFTSSRNQKYCSHDCYIKSRFGKEETHD